MLWGLSVHQMHPSSLLLLTASQQQLTTSWITWRAAFPQLKGNRLPITLSTFGNKNFLITIITRIFCKSNKCKSISHTYITQKCTQTVNNAPNGTTFNLTPFITVKNLFIYYTYIVTSYLLLYCFLQKQFERLNANKVSYKLIPECRMFVFLYC